MVLQANPCKISSIVRWCSSQMATPILLMFCRFAHWRTCEKKLIFHVNFTLFETWQQLLFLCYPESLLFKRTLYITTISALCFPVESKIHISAGIHENRPFSCFTSTNIIPLRWQAHKLCSVKTYYYLYTIYVATNPVTLESPRIFQIWVHSTSFHQVIWKTTLVLW